MKFLLKLAPVPTLESDPGNALAAQALRGALIGVLLYTIPFFAVMIPFFAVRKLAGSALFLIVLLAAFLSLFFFRKGNLKLASWTFLCAAWLFASILVLFSGGISSPGLAVYIPLIIVTALLLGRFAAWVYAAVCVATTLLLALTENAGLHLAKYFPAPPMATWFIILFFVAIVTVPVCRVLGTFSEALTKVHRQVEQLRRQEQELRESEERFRGMADTAPVMIAVSGPDKLATFFNRGWLEFRGRSMEQELGDGWIAGLHPEEREDILAKYASTFRDRRKCCSEYRLLRSDGEYRSILCNAAPRSLGDGTFSGYIATCIDVTDIKRLQQKVLAADKVESLRVLAMGVAHDFRNLLGGVLACAELALDEVESSPMKEDLLRINSAVNLGNEIVDQLMTYAGDTRPSVEEVNLSVLVAEMSQLLKVVISKNVVLKLELTDNLPAVYANPAQIRQVLMNLVLNASEAIGQRDGLIRVSTRLVSGREFLPVGGVIGSGELLERNYILLEVSDNGCGMTAETQSKIFDPFFTTKPSGHGLGLAVVEGIVHTHKGVLALRSLPGQGSIFQILLPIVEKSGHGVSERDCGAAENRFWSMAQGCREVSGGW